MTMVSFSGTIEVSVLCFGYVDLTMSTEFDLNSNRIIYSNENLLLFLTP